MLNAILDDRYQLDMELGRGGMGIVYRARDTILKRPVAIKLLNSASLGGEGQARFLREAQAAALLNHPHIVTIYDVGTVSRPNQPQPESYIVMELVEGRTMANFAAESVEQLYAIVNQVCSALQAAHDNGIIHRDLKPENIILSNAGTVKLTDFGLAQTAGRTHLTQEGAVVGTLGYLAPEVIVGQKATIQSDLYALGVMIYQWLAQRPPFDGDSPTAVLSQHLYAPVVPPSAYNQDFSPQLDRLVIQLLAKQPEDRPSSASEVRSALERLQSTATILEPATLQLSRLTRGRLVGRQPELERATTLWREAIAGTGQLLLISGEPGIGKTRLIRELGTYVELSGGQVLKGECYEEGSGPYEPFSQVLGAKLAESVDVELPAPLLADLVALAPELKVRYPEVPANEPLEPDAEQRRLFESATAWLESMMTSSPLLLVIEDIHWADSGSLALIRHLARHLRRQPLMILASSREVELEESRPLQELLSTLNREQLARRIELARLNREQTANLLTILLNDKIPEELLEAIFQETEGNPFFVEEVCKALVEGGQLRFEGGRWKSPDVGRLEIPQSLRLAIQSRLSHFNQESLQLLQLAALMGREFEYEMLLAVSEVGEASLISVLETAENAQLIGEIRKFGRSAAVRFSFNHALIRSTLLADLGTLRRRRLQRQVATALEDTYPDRREELAPLLGRYFAGAGDGEKAVPYLLQAGDAARVLYAHQEAIANYRQAVGLLTDMGNQGLASRVLMKIGQTHHTAFEFEQSQKAYEQAFSMLQQSELPAAQELLPAPHPLRLVGFVLSTFGPGLTGLSISGPIIRNLFSGLTKLSPEMDVLPDVARSWEMSQGGRKYIFYLREDVFWTDGQPVAAADFEWAWKRVLDPTIGNPLADLFYDIKNARPFHQGKLVESDLVGVHARDDLTLEVELEKPTGYFLQLLAIAYPVPRHVIEREPEKWTELENIVTNGPFMLKDWQLDQDRPTIRFEANPAYHGRFTGNVQQVEIVSNRDFLDPSVGPDELRENRMEMLREGLLDYQSLQGLVPRHVNLARRWRGGELLSSPLFSIAILVFDTRKPPFDDPRVRRAFALATDRERWANVILGGLHFPATGGVVPPGMPGHTPGIALPYDPQQARQLLAEAGYPDGKGLPEISYLHGYWSEWSERQEAFLGSSWRENLGAAVSFEVVDWPHYGNRINEGEHNMYMIGKGADYPDPDSILRREIKNLRGGWQDSHYEQLIEKARREINQEERLRLYALAERILLEQVPVLPIYYRRDLGLLQPWVKKASFNPLTGGFHWEDVVIEPH